MERVSDWRSQLIAAGARFGDNGLVSDFGDPLAEARALQETAVLVPLTGQGLISVSGGDASSFLNAQLTSDVTALFATQAQYSGYCTPKGRLLATMLVFADSDAHWLLLPNELAEAVTARLQKYVLRAKARLRVATGDFESFGITGPGARTAVADGLSLRGQQDFLVERQQGVILITLPGNRFLVVSRVDKATAAWQKLSEHARPGGAGLWELQSIRSGIATITAATQEMFIPQMIALDSHGGVSFEKGCYPGQEIVARTRYLGDLKRRLYRGHCARSVSAGTAIIAGEDDRTVGTVTNAAENGPQSRWEFLAVLQRDAVASKLALRSQAGDAFTIDGPADRRNGN
jgi:folate-binding protein YgfZ